MFIFHDISQIVFTILEILKLTYLIVEEKFLHFTLVGDEKERLMD